MGSEIVGCERCGAAMEPQPDGRTYVCAYCHTQRLVAVDGEQLARGMAVDLSNVEGFLTHLAHSMSKMGERAKIHHNGQRVVHVEIDLGADVFLAKRDGPGVTAQHKKIVRGIALKTTTHPLDRWYDMLTKALATHANENARASQALSHLKGGR